MATMSIKTIGGVEICVNEAGKFFAEIDGKIVHRASLGALERLIQERANPVPVIVLDKSFGWRVKRDEIVRASGDRLKGKGGSTYRRWEPVYLYDEVAMGEFKKLLEEYEKLSRRWDEIKKTLVEVTAKNLEELRIGKSAAVSENNISQNPKKECCRAPTRF